ncbi:bifunctional chorismate mutase/prephenate dehydrogenase [Candidatus Pacearchaeota archaeon]|nr:bifunctional chorismate mutase/prephenate dehydrogenase [Candidatus Pacearchaeota archaeon]
MEKINKSRKAINEIDEEILKLLSKRKNLIEEIGKLKNSLDIPIFDKKREEEILDKISQKAKKHGLNKEFIEEVFGVVFKNSRTSQQRQFRNVNCRIKKIGLIGFGRFGKLIVNHLSNDFEFYAYDKSNKKAEIRKNNAIPSSLRQVCKNEIVVLAVPISEMKNTLKNIKNLLKKGSLVIDVCSVKEYPVKLMENILPRNTQILATHPLFGTDTASDSLEGRKIVLCKVRISDNLYSQIKRFLESKGLLVIEKTPKQHDKEIAKSLVLTHFIGRALINMKASNVDIDTRGYRDLIRILGTVKNDAWQLFEDMNKYNKYSGNVRSKFIGSIEKINNKLQKSNL